MGLFPADELVCKGITFLGLVLSVSAVQRSLFQVRECHGNTEAAGQNVQSRI